jgi:hypothetical protein
MNAFLMSSLTKAYGILCLGGAFLIGLAWIANRRTMRMAGPAGHDLNGIQFLALFFALLGVALMMKWLWAHLLFVAMTTTAGIWIVVGSVASIPFPFLILTLMYAVGLLVPLTLSVASWRKARLMRNGI